MAKKKDTLKDLSDFMKNQPQQDDENQDFMKKKPTKLAAVEKMKDEVEKLSELPAGSVLENELVKLIKKIADAANVPPRQVLYNICEAVIENEPEKSGSDIMLSNTILFLKHHDLITDKLK